MVRHVLPLLFVPIFVAMCAESMLKSIQAMPLKMLPPSGPPLRKQPALG